MSEDTIDSIVLFEPAETVRSALAEGVVNARDLRRKTGIPVNNLRVLCQRHDVYVPADVVLYKPREGLAECVARGLTLKQIGDHYNVTRERARQLLFQGGLFPVWKIRREEQKRKRPVQKLHEHELQKFTCLLNDYLGLRCREESWATRKTVEYFQKMSRTRYSKTQLLQLFFAYDSATNKNKKLSLQELMDMCGIQPPQISKILQTVNVVPMYRKVDRHYVSQERKEVIRKCFGLNASTVDIAYLLGEKTYIVSEVFRQLGGRPKQKKHSLPQKMVVSYRDASLIYLGQDIGLSVEEIAQELDKKPRLVQYVLERRNTISPRIIEVLKAKNPDIETPYN